MHGRLRLLVEAEQEWVLGMYACVCSEVTLGRDRGYLRNKTFELILLDGQRVHGMPMGLPYSIFLTLVHGALPR